MSQNEILKRIHHDGQRDLTLIYEKCRPQFLQWIVKHFHCSVEDSKDIYQITTVIFYENVRSGKVLSLKSSIKTYLFAIGRNVAHEYLRKNGGVRKYDVDLFMHNLPDEQDEQIDESSFEAASKAVARLNDTGRQLIQLYYYDKKSMGEISALLKYKNAGTAKTQKCKVMSRLRKLFDDEVRKGEWSVGSVRGIRG